MSEKLTYLSWILLFTEKRENRDQKRGGKEGNVAGTSEFFELLA